MGGKEQDGNENGEEPKEQDAMKEDGNSSQMDERDNQRKEDQAKPSDEEQNGEQNKEQDEEIENQDENKEQDEEIKDPDENKERNEENHEEEIQVDREEIQNNSMTEKIVMTPQKIHSVNHIILARLLGNIVWPEESPQKKNRPKRKDGKQREHLPHSATSAKWLSYWEGLEEEKTKKEEKKIKKAAREEKKKPRTVKGKKLGQTSSSKKKPDWMCPKCKGSFNMDVAMCNCRKWIGPCHDCDNWYHRNCISKKLVLEFGLDDLSDIEESDFVCDTCFGLSDEEFGVFELESDNE